VTRSDPQHTAEFRFYAELNDFLAPARRGVRFAFGFNGNPGIKDPIEALGVPHTEVELIVVNARPVGFDHKLNGGDNVAVYPTFHGIDIDPLATLRPALAEAPSFVADVHLGKLARHLRLLGFDVAYRNDLSDREIVQIALEQGRVILTRDRRLLFNRRIIHACFVRSDDPVTQTGEVLRRYDLRRAIAPFHRCLKCNGSIEPVAKTQVLERLLPRTRKYYDTFYRCRCCGRVYWQGPHYEDLLRQLEKLGGPGPTHSCNATHLQ
jgi:uncharacterized protein with PIN domain